MTCDASLVARSIDALAARLGAAQSAGQALAAKEQLVLRLNQQYPRDVGVLSAFFLNLVRGALQRAAGAAGPGARARPAPLKGPPLSWRSSGAGSEAPGARSSRRRQPAHSRSGCRPRGERRAAPPSLLPGQAPDPRAPAAA
jgi:hypothetical protein